MTKRNETLPGSPVPGKLPGYTQCLEHRDSYAYAAAQLERRAKRLRQREAEWKDAAQEVADAERREARNDPRPPKATAQRIAEKQWLRTELDVRAASR